MRVKLMLVLIASGLSLVVWATPSRLEAPYQCELLGASTVVLSGRINEEMADCADALLRPEITTVVVASDGGETFAGRRIGHRIGDRPRTLVIRDRCLSSCANYFIPAARRLELGNHAVIGLHGTPDPSMRERSRFAQELEQALLAGEITEDNYARSIAQHNSRWERQLAEEQAFAERFAVPPGWRLYRDADDSRLGFLQYFIGTTDQLEASNWTMLVVEAPMLRSCLPGLQVSASAALSEGSDRRAPQPWVRWAVLGNARSGDLRCAPASAEAEEEPASADN
ncbi:hypothetical protein [uncultured Maricaulis sp.]|uniref:hypothetical protein n=1 Tax=uncultured Maricaulis sp. TaxID=174710 RepID=UPI0026232619|nr:hypothetical protein [uncultured Maricaulis sp.]